MTSMRPLIGVTTSDNKSRLAWFFDWLAVWRAGGRPVRLSPGRTSEYESLDGLVIGGGDDIQAHLYEGHLQVDVRVDPARDQLELLLLEKLTPNGIPILGICRGSQMINIFYGGTLHQDIHLVYEQTPRMRTVLPRKTVMIEDGSRLGDIMGIDECRVNSLHHQSVNRLGKNLRIVAREPSGVVQGVECPEHHFMIGVQWHPEFLIFTGAQQRLFRALVKAAN
jgi:putative glutamine amidotransferase